MASEVDFYLSDDDVEHFLEKFSLLDHLRLYADDTVVLAESADELRHALHAVHDYCNTWKLTVNTDKTKIVVFQRQSNLLPCLPFYS